MRVQMVWGMRHVCVMKSGRRILLLKKRTERVFSMRTKIGGQGQRAVRRGVGMGTGHQG